MVVCNVHPGFDPYMQKGIMDRNDVITDFETYFTSPVKYVVHKQVGDKTFIFEDYHYTFSDFINTASNEGLYVDEIDECPPDPNKRHLDPDYYDRKRLYPTFYVMRLKLKKQG